MIFGGFVWLLSFSLGSYLPPFLWNNNTTNHNNDRCHCRMVYLPMSYLYGVRFVYDRAETDPVTVSLREELYMESMDYDTIPWSKTRHLIAEPDNYSPVPKTMEVRCCCPSVCLCVCVYVRFCSPLLGQLLAHFVSMAFARPCATHPCCLS